MENSVIIRCYNTLPLIKKCVKAAIATTDHNTEIILVNNHPPYQDVRKFLHRFKHPRVKVLDPGENIGNIEGFNYGAAHAMGENLIILDDDIIVENNNWIEVMNKSFEDFPNLAYVVLTWPAIKDYNVSSLDQLFEKSEYTIRMMDEVVIFGCAMIKKSLWKEHFKNIEVKLHWYGIDREYKFKAQDLGMDTGIILSHKVEHLARTKKSDPLFGAWKIFYTYEFTEESYTVWKQNKSSLSIDEIDFLEKFGYQQSLIKDIKQIIEKKR
ncbi:glycosyltransferase family 2 protein [Chengkuizengella marina]|uniref:Glycosyltransferase family 2 protein n=1 Tax=Chengkuizengella marina TaxID=2507566 RepID=A0A6N9Q2N3_9BACL|nr:glycosyltransferase family A protein [Chengkuizengella marina]NBI28718.1 glycosyltransferase family 2 protein [Chengkuizengella marina]